MVLNEFAGLRGAASSSANPQHVDLSFDFVVAERPRYVPNSGPPLAPLSLLPIHDKDGVILESIMLHEQLRYIVGYEDSPNLLIAVRPQNILDWVSPRTYEEYGMEQSRIQKKVRQEKELRIAEAREERRIRKEMKRAEKEEELRGNESGKKRKRSSQLDGPRITGRPQESRSSVTTPRKPFGPGRRKQANEDAACFKSPRLSLRSQQQPSLSKPSRGLADVVIADSESEDELALDRQVIADSRRFYISIASSISKTTSPEPPGSGRSPEQAALFRNRTHLDSPSFAAKKVSIRKEITGRYSPASPLGAQAYASSLEARAIYEELERKSIEKAQAQSSPRKRSKLEVPESPLRDTQHGPEGPTTHSQTLEEGNPDNDQYEVRTILDDQIREIDGKPRIFYLIEWVGLWDDTWEPAENVGAEAIAQYRKKKAQQRALGLNGAQDNGNRNGLQGRAEVTEGKGNGNGRVEEVAWQRGSSIYECMNDEVDLL